MIRLQANGLLQTEGYESRLQRSQGNSTDLPRALPWADMKLTPLASWSAAKRNEWEIEEKKAPEKGERLEDEAQNKEEELKKGAK